MLRKIAFKDAQNQIPLYLPDFSHNLEGKTGDPNNKDDFFQLSRSAKVKV